MVSAAASANPRILLAEDNADVARLEALALRALVPGATVDRVDNGADAQPRMTGPDPFHLLVCDIMMPRLDGSRLLRQLAEHPAARGVPVIVVSGVSQARLEGIRELDNVVEVLRKPVDPVALAQKVAALLASRR